MTFDPTFQPNRDNLAPRLVEMMNRVFFTRRAMGHNVQFDNNGRLDEWSFESAERAQGFAASLTRQGRASAISN